MSYTKKNDKFLPCFKYRFIYWKKYTLSTTTDTKDNPHKTINHIKRVIHTIDPCEILIDIPEELTGYFSHQFLKIN